MLITYLQPDTIVGVEDFEVDKKDKVLAYMSLLSSREETDNKQANQTRAYHASFNFIKESSEIVELLL